ncbi:MAG TPA: TadE/TadG family type IV pilus assembly protein [Candidatus Sulfotelmatobacter sp.]|nr:TadE/TadG family type IV pilus assembly protein [Candidatus Sulfotelmatobacter sp.]
MRISPRSIIRRLVAETRGSEIAEAAAVLPLMFMILLGIFWFGQAFSIYGTITRAAQEGARAGAAPYCTTCNSPNNAAQNAYNAVHSSLAAAHLDPNQIIPLTSWTPPAPVDCSTGTAVACTNSGNVCVQTHVMLSHTSGAGAVCGTSVSFEYPYRFWLPFTSLNKQSIQLQAVAHVRMEAQ